MAALLNNTTLSKTGFVLWVILLSVLALTILTAVAYSIVITRSANKFYIGKSIEDESVRRLAMIVSSRKAVCRIIIFHSAFALLLSCIEFIFANINPMIGACAEAIIIFSNLLICILRIRGEQEFYKTAKY